MKKKISLKDYTKRAEALRMIEIDSIAAEIYGEFETYFINHNHAERISKIIVEAASNGRTNIEFTSSMLDEWYKGEKLTRYFNCDVTLERYLNTEILKKIAIRDYDKMHFSYGKFLILKMAEQLSNTFDGKITVRCKTRYFSREECVLRFDWSDESCQFNKIHIRDFFPLTIFLKNYDWDDWVLNVATIFGLTLGAVMIGLCVGIVFLIISETAADIAFFISFISQIALNFIVKFKPKRNLIYEGNVFNN